VFTTLINTASSSSYTTNKDCLLLIILILLLLLLLLLPADSLGSAARPRHGEQDPITVVRHRWAIKIINQARETHRKDLREGRAPFNSEKMRRYVRLVQQDLTRPNLAQCAKYLTMNLTANQEAAFLQLRT